jgi:DNA-binding HxlR family transcriptional regulator
MYICLPKVSTILQVSSYLWVITMGKIFANKEKINQTQCLGRLNSIADALFVIGGKWKLRIILALSENNRRFNELQRMIDGISAKVLSTELKDLELNGFIKRNVFTGTPVTVEYELTGYAASLQGVLIELSEWGAKHKEKIRKSMRLKEAMS